ncbi:hypothetical protein QTH97_26290 [Variovorax sp. J22R24]|uniref:hypothetical protein n=1 Tax=Variovorax gracilis TaxID=3053502 RepID=UPI002574A1E0|nr:hypothetical protein [Variovorax sp. J22R24]MDM0108486.1 hypothetical protein [Variovorax sp. J22R24]
MNEATQQFFNDYVRRLDALQGWNDVNTQLADWHFQQKDEQVIAPVVDDINACLNWENHRNRFRDHVLTTLVGQPGNGLLFVSANPGWNERANNVESAFRANQANNQQFGSDFFHVFHQLGLKNNWWSRAILLAHLVYTGGEAEIPAGLRWNWAQEGHAIGNLDLLPFHSTGDQFGTLRGPGVRAALRDVARSTLQTALRLTPMPRLIFVASALGAPIADALCVELGMVHVPGPDDAPQPFAQLNRYVHLETGARVMTFPYQTFAGNAAIYLPVGFMRPLAAQLRQFGNF